MVVSSPQRGEDMGFLSGFPIVGIHSYGILLVIPLELQGKSINYFLWHRQTKQPYAMTEPSKKGPPSNVVEAPLFCPLRRTEQPAPTRLGAPHSLP